MGRGGVNKQTDEGTDEWKCLLDLEDFVPIAAADNKLWVIEKTRPDTRLVVYPSRVQVGRGYIWGH